MTGISALAETGKEPAVAARPPGRRQRRGRRRRTVPRGWNDWPVSWRLMAVAIIAVLVDLILGGSRVAATADSTAALGRVTQLAVLGQRVTGLAQALEDERDQLAGFIAAGRPAQGIGPVNSSQARTDTAATAVTAAALGIGAGFPAATRAKVTAVLDRIADLPGLRKAGSGTQLPSLPVIMDYSAAIADLFSLNDEIAQGGIDPAVADGVRALGDLSRLEEAASRQRAILFAALTEQHFEPGALAALTSAQSAQAGYLQTFQATAAPALQQAFSDQVTGAQVDQAQLIEQRVTTTGSPQTAGLGLPGGNPAAEWYAAMTGTLAPIRTVEDRLTSSIIAQSQALQSGPQRSALLTVCFMIAVLIFVLAATLVVARSLVLPLRRLKTGALEIASASLPARVKELTEHPGVSHNLEVTPISVRSADEIGQVARAFDQVHAEALRLAGNEAILRGNVSAMFVSLSYRSQSSIDRLAAMLTAAGGRQLDEALRSDLAAMDRLLARMRRNFESLLVVAGYEAVRKRSGPVPLTEIVRAAASGIDPGRHLSVYLPPELAVLGYAATDVTHLLAELIENAANFSPPRTTIRLSASYTPDGGLQLDVADEGLGIPADRLAEMNARLADPPVADALVSRHLGLFAVAHLAARHGGQVRLRLPTKGTVAQAWFPAAIITDGARAEAAGRPDRLAATGPQPSSPRHGPRRAGSPPPTPPLPPRRPE